MNSLDQLLSVLSAAQENARRDADSLRQQRTVRLLLQQEVDILEVQKQTLLLERLPALQSEAASVASQRRNFEDTVLGKEKLAEVLLDSVNQAADVCLINAKNLNKDQRSPTHDATLTAGTDHRFFSCFAAATSSAPSFSPDPHAGYCCFHRALINNSNKHRSNNLSSNDSSNTHPDSSRTHLLFNGAPHFIRQLASLDAETCSAALWKEATNEYQTSIAAAPASFGNQQKQQHQQVILPHSGNTSNTFTTADSENSGASSAPTASLFKPKITRFNAHAPVVQPLVQSAAAASSLAALLHPSDPEQQQRQQRIVIGEPTDRDDVGQAITSRKRVTFAAHGGSAASGDAVTMATTVAATAAVPAPAPPLLPAPKATNKKAAAPKRPGALQNRQDNQFNRDEAAFENNSW